MIVKLDARVKNLVEQLCNRILLPKQTSYSQQDWFSYE